MKYEVQSHDSIHGRCRVGRMLSAIGKRRKSVEERLFISHSANMQPFQSLSVQFASSSMEGSRAARKDNRCKRSSPCLLKTVSTFQRHNESLIDLSL